MGNRFENKTLDARGFEKYFSPADDTERSNGSKGRTNRFYAKMYQTNPNSNVISRHPSTGRSLKGIDDNKERNQEVADSKYRKDWNRAQKELDREYQSKLKQINDEALNRMDQYQKEHEVKMAQLRAAHKEQLR